MDGSIVNVTLPDKSVREIKEGTTVNQLAKEFQKNYDSLIVAAKVNSEVRELTFSITDNCNISFLDLSTADGNKIFTRSLVFLLIKAVKELYPTRNVVVNYSISKGLYIEVNGESELTENEVVQIEEKMKEIVKKDLKIDKKVVTLDEARELFLKTGRNDRYQALEFRSKPHVTLYSLDGLEDYFYGYMVPSTGYLKIFALKFLKPGLILLYQDTSKPNVLPEFKEQKKLFSVFLEHKKWLRILGVSNVADLNRIVKSGNAADFIRVAEALHEKKIAQIADMITCSDHKKRVVLISGPSSSGKTTFAHRLAIQLRVSGIKPVTVSLDDYFLNRDDTPKDEYGNYDFESIEAIDVAHFNKQLAQLVNGEEVEIPIFNFNTGSRETKGRMLKLEKDQIMIIEGIHGLNEKLSSLIPRDSKFKIYVSALTSLNIDEHNRIQTTDTRFIRRIVRDFQFRGSTASNTIRIWPSVRRGEEKNIFPFQEEADVMFNSALNYELSALRNLAETLLNDVKYDDLGYSEAKRLLEFIRNFMFIEPRDIPLNSIVREFLGGSCFYR